MKTAVVLMLESDNDSQTEKGLEEDISIHIFSKSATMVGVCPTVIGIFKLLLNRDSS